jgi:uncharacterized integral membrane protein
MDTDWIKESDMRPKIIAVLILAVLFLIFIIQNVETINVKFLMFEISMPRALTLIITLAVGLIIGIVLPYEFKKIRSKK